MYVSFGYQIWFLCTSTDQQINWIRVKVDLYEIFLYYIIYCLLFIIMTIQAYFNTHQICGTSHTRGKKFRKYWPQVFDLEEDKD